MTERPHGKRWEAGSWAQASMAILVLYLLSSGPVLALSFWLREVTHWDGFYATMWLYYPLLIFGHFPPLDAYITWWVVKVFHTVGPG